MGVTKAPVVNFNVGDISDFVTSLKPSDAYMRQ